MKNEAQLRLYLVTNPVPFSRYEDHETAIQIQLHDLIETAIEEKEDPVALVEEYLKITYSSGDTIDDMVNFLINTDQMRLAMHGLRDNWHNLDESLPEDSLMFGAATRQDAARIYSQTTFRNYLEALANVYNS